MPTAVTDATFETEVLKSDKPVLVDFWAPWCGPCRMVSPVVEELETELGGAIKVAKVNVDDEPDIASRYGVMSIPMLALFKNGEVAASSVGARPKEEIRRLLGI